MKWGAQISNGRPGTTAPPRWRRPWVYCKKGHCLEAVKFYGCTRERPQYSRVCFVQKRWLTGFTVTLVATYSETGSVKFKDARV